MTYSIDTIPAKTFFKIHETQDLSLLSSVDLEEKKLQEVWDEINYYDNQNSKSKKYKKVLNIQKKIRQLSAKYQSLSKALFFLSHKRDSDLESLVKSYNYKILDSDFKNSIEKSIKLIEGVKNRIKRHEKELEDLFQESKSNDKTTFEKTLMSYYVFLGITLHEKSKDVLLVDFRGLENEVSRKIKALENEQE